MKTPSSHLRHLEGKAINKARSSNLELYRILCMLMIVAHHYVVNSGLTSVDGPLMFDPISTKSIILTLLGAWGKTGINCFLMITGYFMCRSEITIRKFIKLLGQIYLYSVLIFIIMFFAGYESLSLTRLVKVVFPLWGLKNNFISCFIGFWLTIPFLNILVQNMTKRQHKCLLVLVFGMFTLLGSVPTFSVGMEYVTWFGIIYLLSSYIRLYPNPLFFNRKLWGWMTLLSFVLAVTSILCMRMLFSSKGVGVSYYFVYDSNKIFAVAIAVCSFLWFKNINMNYSRIVNSFGAGTFGVLLIHANSNAMRKWLWEDTFDVLGHYESLTTGEMTLFSVGVVLTVFIICNLVDQFRIATLEKWFLDYYDNKVSVRAQVWKQKVLH